MSSLNTFTEDAKKFNKISAAARAEATRKWNYSSEETREDLRKYFLNANKGKKEPYKWQIDIGEAIHLGLDCVLIAGTGAGKTYPMIISQLLPENKKKFTLIISPLNALEEDQVLYRLAVSL